MRDLGLCRQKIEFSTRYPDHTSVSELSTSRYNDRPYDISRLSSKLGPISTRTGSKLLKSFIFGPGNKSFSKISFLWIIYNEKQPCEAS